MHEALSSTRCESKIDGNPSFIMIKEAYNILNTFDGAVTFYF